MNKGRPKNSSREELVHMAHLLEAVPMMSNLEIAARLRISRNRVPKHRNWLEQKGFVATKAERKAAFKEQIIAIAEKSRDLPSILMEIRSNHSDLPSSESHVRKILKEAGVPAYPEREFNLIRYKPRKTFKPAFWKYSQKYKNEQLVRQGWRRLEKDLGDPTIPSVERPQCAKSLRKKERHERRKEQEARGARYKPHSAIKVRR